MAQHEGRKKLDAILGSLTYVTRGPWTVFTGCSWRRIGRDGPGQDDRAVLAPTTASDGHPELMASGGNDLDANLEHITRCDPDSFEQIGDYVRGLEERLASHEETLRRIAILTPAAANARSAEDLHLSVKAIVETALDTTIAT
jgi:hypothetical protein